MQKHGKVSIELHANHAVVGVKLQSSTGETHVIHITFAELADLASETELALEKMEAHRTKKLPPAKAPD